MSEEYHGAWSGSKPELADLHTAYEQLDDSMKEFHKRVVSNLRSLVSNKVMSAKKAQYWLSGREKFARCFERYVQRKLQTDGRENTYLSGMVSMNVDMDDGSDADTGSKLWPTNAEVDQMTPAFDAIFAAYKKQK